MSSLPTREGPDLEELTPGQRRRRFGVSLWRQLPLVLWLVLMWIMLWDHFTPVSVASGFVVAFLVTKFFYLPAVELSGRFNVLWFGVFLVTFVYDVIVGSLQVAYQAIRRHPPATSSVVSVPLHTRSDLLITLVAQVLTLVPGSLVLEVNRPESVLYIHDFGDDSDRRVRQTKQSIQRIEERLVRAMGSKDDVHAINVFRVEQGKAPIRQGAWSVFFVPGRRRLKRREEARKKAEAVLGKVPGEREDD